MEKSLLDENKFLSASDNKTIRLWQIPNLTLQNWVCETRFKETNGFLTTPNGVNFTTVTVFFDSFLLAKKKEWKKVNGEKLKIDCTFLLFHITLITDVNGTSILAHIHRTYQLGLECLSIK